jgi:cyclase
MTTARGEHQVSTMFRTQRLMAIGGTALLLASATASPSAQQPPTIQIQPVQGNIYMLVGAGANITLSAGDDGLLLVDTGTSGAATQVMAAISRLPRFFSPTGDPPAAGAPMRTLRYVINTSALTDHAGGNQAIVAAAGAPQVFAHENVLSRLTDAKVPQGGLPSLTFFGNRMALSRWVNGEPVEIVHMPAAITDGDTVVVFHRSSVLSTGEIFDYTQFPRIDVAGGGSVEGLIAALNRLLTMTFPNGNTEGGTYIVGAHGRICDTTELSNYRNMVTIVRDRVAALIKKNMTLPQVKAARPTEDYDTEFGRNPSWTPDMFVEAVFTSLKNSANPTR